jgi:pimeloyl-ACP methyl ester carboxylesterase
VLLDLDVRQEASSLTTPTLVLHARGDARVPFSQGVAYASLIRGSRFVPLDSRNHLMRPDEPAWAHFLREVDDFLAQDESTR